MLERNSKAELWREWLATKAENRRLGWHVARAIRDHVQKVERENEQLVEKMNAYDDIRKVLTALGWKDPDKEHWLDGRAVTRKIETLQEVVPAYVLRQMKDLETNLRNLRDYLSASERSES